MCDKKIYFTKPVQTRDGRKVRIFATDAAGAYPVVGQIDGDDDIERWNADGQFFNDMSSNRLDLVNVPRTLTVYMNVYLNSGRLYCSNTYVSREQADVCATTGRVGCIKVELAERYDD